MRKLIFIFSLILFSRSIFATNYYCPTNLDCSNNKCALGTIVGNTMQVMYCLDSEGINNPCAEVSTYILTKVESGYAFTKNEGTGCYYINPNKPTNMIILQPFGLKLLYADMKADNNLWLKTANYYAEATCKVENEINNCPLVDKLQ